jgi:hypothetical protein
MRRMLIVCTLVTWDRHPYRDRFRFVSDLKIK